VKAMGSDPRNGEVFVSYAIIGFGKIGQALATFARSGITTTLHDPGFRERLIGYRQARTLSRIP
jgi:phosphoglycerate dehydrogenase-like enzyme